MNREEETAMRIRIVRGTLLPEELAALTAVLTARVATSRSAERPRFAHGSRYARARWRRLDRGTGYRNPVSWR
ncbi:acyl-CoA carboxylase subunit epsilon [Streptacidiphilus neutrinimicus]|uniref:acyl-CoA carboxylase subunit epsilon n=1 Tax=Streptacidiphilus neutrinimicus TaxID=105420 RepID=UPI0005A92AAA|nr:acyl-CoA carboxylase subunit epsilon [Streptacidiphilus neutrinimicus]